MLQPQVLVKQHRHQHLPSLLGWGKDCKMLLATPGASGLCRPSASAAQVSHQQRHSLPTFRTQRHATHVASAYYVLEDAPLAPLDTLIATEAAPEAVTAAPVAAEAPAAAVATPAATATSLSVPDLPDVSGVTQQAAEQLQDINASVSQAAAGVTDKAAELADAASKATSNVTESAAAAAAGLTSAVSGATSSVTDALSGSGSGVSSNVENLKSSLGQGVSGISSQVGSLTGQVGDTVVSTLSGLKANLDSATSGVSGALGQGVSQVTSTTKAATDAVTAAVSSGTAAVQQTLDTVSNQVAAVTDQVASSVDATTQQVLGALPPPVKDALVAAGGAAAAAGGQVVAHPKEAAVLALAVGVPTAYSYYKGRYGGYAGEAAPEKVYDLLSSDDNIFLVDIRPEETREKEGLPQLKLGARYKVAAFPVQVSIPSRVAREAVNADELRLQVNAAFIAGLPQCQGPLTKMIIMDSNGSDKARDLARALTSLGQPLSYVMTGGFKAWRAADLPVLEDESEYDASTGAVLSDNVEVLAEKANEVAKTVSQPQIALPLVGGSALGIYAALNIHTTLQYIGVLSVLLTIVNKALSYDSPAAAIEDAKGAVSGAQKALSKLGSIKPPAVGSFKAPSMPNLPKLPAGDGMGGGRAAAVGSSGSGSAAGAALSAAAVAGAGASAGRADVDVGEETETELVD